MRKKRFSVEQMIGVLKQAELVVPVAEVIRKAGISEQTFYRWKAKYAGLEVDQVRQMAQLQEENLRLKKLVAELVLDKTMLQDVLSKKWRRLGCGQVSGVPVVQGRRPDAEADEASRQAQGCSSTRGEDQAHGAGSGMEHGLRLGPATGWHALPFADHRRCLHARGGGDRSGSEPEGR